MIILNNLEEVDVKLALNMMGGYEVVYQKVVQSFLLNHQSVINGIKNNLNYNKKEARRIVHSYKGISKNIGSEKLYEVSKEFEQVIIDNNEPLINDYFKIFEVIFNKVVNDLQKIKFD